MTDATSAVQEPNHAWAELAQFGPEEFEAFVEKVYAEYNQAFKPISVDVKNRKVRIELKDGRKVEETI